MKGYQKRGKKKRYKFPCRILHILPLIPAAFWEKRTGNGKRGTGRKRFLQSAEGNSCKTGTGDRNRAEFFLIYMGVS